MLEVNFSSVCAKSLFDDLVITLLDHNENYDMMI